ncbi:Os11g0227000, partial [Oryza sativa Japonica Group]
FLCFVSAAAHASTAELRDRRTSAAAGVTVNSMGKLKQICLE